MVMHERRRCPYVVSRNGIIVPCTACKKEAVFRWKAVKTGSTLRNSGVQSYLTEGHWLYHMWCTLVDSLVPDLCCGGAEVVWRMQDLA